MVRGLGNVDQPLTLNMAAYNLAQLKNQAQLRPQCGQ